MADNLTVANPITGNNINVNGRTFTNLLKRGYVYTAEPNPRMRAPRRQYQDDIPVNENDQFNPFTEIIPQQNRFMHRVRTTHSFGFGGTENTTSEHVIYLPSITMNNDDLFTAVQDRMLDLESSGIYLLGDSNQEIVSVELIGIPIRIRNFNIGQLTMASGLFTQYLALKEYDDSNGINTGPVVTGDCVVDYIHAVTGYKIDSIKHDLGVRGFKGYTLNQIISYAERRDLSLYCIEPMLSKIVSRTASSTRHVKCLAFIIANNHLHALNSTRLKRVLAKTKQLDIKELQFLTKFDGTIPIYEASDDLKRDGVHIVFDRDTFDLIDGDEIGHLNMDGSGKIRSVSYVNRIVISCDDEDYYNRKEMCKTLHESTGLDFYETFLNYSYAAMAAELFPNMDDLKSDMNSDVLKIFGMRFGGPVVRQFASAGQDICTTVDIIKSYTNALLTSDDQFPIYIYSDHPRYYNGRELTAGVYYIERLCLGANIVVKGWLPHTLVKYAIERGYCATTDIKYELRASKFLPADVFVDYVQRVIGYVGGITRGKHLVNAFTGLLGRRTIEYCEGMYDSTFELCSAIALLKLEQGYSADVNQINDLYYLTVKKVYEKQLNSSPIYRQILAQGVIQLHELEMSYKLPVISMKTDSVTFRGVIDLPPTDAIGGYRVDFQGVPESLYGSTTEMDPIDYRLPWTPLEETELSQANYIQGNAGSGKTWYLCEQVDPERDIVLVPTHKVRHAILDTFRKMGRPSCSVVTLASHFGEGFGTTRRRRKIKAWMEDFNGTVFVDEITMMQVKYLPYFIRMRERESGPIRIRVFGDTNQLSAVDFPSVNLLSCKFFMQRICDNKTAILPYNADLGRYDDDLYNVLFELLRDGTSSYNFNGVDPDLMTNICATNAMVKQRNTHCNKLFNDGSLALGRDVFTVGDLEITDGTKIFCNRNRRIDSQNQFRRLVPREDGFEYTNNEMYTVCGRVSDDVLIQNEDWTVVVPSSIFEQDFVLGWAATIHKYQGTTIEGNYNIFLSNSFGDLNMIYTALSRARTASCIHINLDLSRRVWRPHNFNIKLQQKVREFEIVDGKVVRSSLDDPEEEAHRDIVPYAESEIHNPQHLHAVTDSVAEVIN